MARVDNDSLSRYDLGGGGVGEGWVEVSVVLGIPVLLDVAVLLEVPLVLEVPVVLEVTCSAGGNL